MRTQWKPLQSNTQGLTRYQGTNQRAKASIQRNSDGSATAEQKSGLFGLGTHVSSYSVSPAPADSVILDRMDRIAHPPKYDGWKKGETQQDTNTTEYTGKANNLFKSPVKAKITRVGDSAKVSAKVGHFGLGTHVDGVFFAPAPSDQEILRRISD